MSHSIMQLMKELKDSPDFLGAPNAELLNDYCLDPNDNKVGHIQTELYKKLSSLNHNTKKRKKLYDLLLLLAESYPKNDIDPVSQKQLPGELDEGEHIVFVSSGHQFILENLIQYANTQGTNNITNPFTRQPFIDCDKQHIIQMAIISPAISRIRNDYSLIINQDVLPLLSLNPVTPILAGKVLEGAILAAFLARNFVVSIIKLPVKIALYCTQDKIIWGFLLSFATLGLMYSLSPLTISLAALTFLALIIPPFNKQCRLTVSRLLNIGNQCLNIIASVVAGFTGALIGGVGALSCKAIRSSCGLFTPTASQHRLNQRENPDNNSPIILAH